MTEIIKTLVGFAIIYMITEALMPTEKFKPYIQLIIGLGIVITLTGPVLKIINTDININYNKNPSSDGTYRDDILEIWKNHTESGIISTSKALLAESFPDERFTIRVIKQGNNSFRIYITAYSELSDKQIYDIKNIISENLSISATNVNIYLQKQSQITQERKNQ